jgi:hypothetical protein
LSKAFNAHVAQILFRPAFQIVMNHLKNGYASTEVWIKYDGQKKDVLKLAKTKSGIQIRGISIQCEAVLEPLENRTLCKNFNRGTCKYNPCYYKHYQCTEPDTCNNAHCLLGHSTRRIAVSNRRLENSKCIDYCLSFLKYSLYV